MFTIPVYTFLETWNFPQVTLKNGYYLPTPPLRQDMTQGQFLSGV